jgi:WhiB family redox-sensing transcriptional regulator
MAVSGRNMFVDHEVATDWRDDAECARVADGINFFPERGESAARAKSVCAGCSVREPCLEFALSTNVSAGVWGGLSGRERRQLLRQRRIDARRP